MELLEKYREQYNEFCKIDDFNLEDRSKRIPAEKHFWVCRLIDAKIERERLIKQKTKTKKSMEMKLLKESPVTLNRQIADEIENAPSLETLNNQIREYEFLIEYLEKLVNQVTYIAQDIKNIISIKQLQEL